VRQAEPIAPRPAAGGELPLSLAQERLWFLSRLDPHDASFNLFLVYRLRGDLDPEALKRALGDVVARHEILRTRYPALPDGRPVQVVEPSWRAGLERVDLSGLAADERERLAHELVAERVNAPFDLADRPPFRASLIRLDGRDHVLCLVLHYVAGDGWSVGVLWRELAALYAAALAGAPSPLPPLPVQYADYAIWQRRRLDGDAVASQLAYWRERLADAPVLDLPVDRARPAVRTSRGAAVTRRVALGPAVDRLARDHRCTAFMVLLAAFQALLGRAAGQDDVCVGSPTAGRDQLELEPLIGLFLNTLVLRGDLSGDPTFAELLGRTRARAVEAYTHQDVPFERLMTELRVRREPGQTPLFQAMFALENPDAAGPAFAGLDVEAFEAGYRQARLDLSLEVWRDGPELVCIFEYRSDLFEPATAGRLAAGYEALLRAALDDPGARLSTLFARALSQDDRRHLAAWAGGPDRDEARASLTGLFEARAARRPDALAVSAEGEDLSYGELDRRADRLARALRRRGVGPETRVAVVARRSPALIVALLAARTCRSTPRTRRSGGRPSSATAAPRWCWTASWPTRASPATTRRRRPRRRPAAWRTSSTRPARRAAPRACWSPGRRSWPASSGCATRTSWARATGSCSSRRPRSTRTPRRCTRACWPGRRWSSGRRPASCPICCAPSAGGV
jgi:hypothetical protein